MQSRRRDCCPPSLVAAEDPHANHNRAAGFAADLENQAERVRQPQAARRATRARVGQYLEAVLAGWRVVRLGPAELTLPVVGRLVAMVTGSAPESG